MADNNVSGAVGGGARALLRLEGLGLLCGAAALYWRSGGDWRLFAALFLAPDLSFAGYLGGPRIGAAAYNAMHSTVGALLLAAAGIAFGQPLATMIALIWFAHVGFDRALGYGLKYGAGFSFTHLGRIGRKPQEN
ncbi:MAG TPA: DUF4260 domain-containing protein [Rhizomicrobium sp.]|jgi:hypothetical protein|nr:DUF4260 domain-containing protein [Rhizomicrobium sp.]